MEDAKAADKGRRNLYKVETPDALKALIKAADATNEKANKVAHAQTKKNLNELSALAKKDITHREDTLKTLAKATDVLKVEAQAVVKDLPSLITQAEGLGRAGAVGISSGRDATDVHQELKAEIAHVVQSMVQIQDHVHRVQKLSGTLDSFPHELHAIVARFLTSMDGIDGAFRSMAKALAAGNFATIARIAENDLKSAPEKLATYIREW